MERRPESHRESRQGHVQEEMQGLFPNLYRPHTEDPSPPCTTSVQVTISRVQDNMATVMHSLNPGFSLTRGLGRGIPTYSRLTTNPVPAPSTASSSPRSSHVPLLRSSPYPAYNQRQTYFASRRPRTVSHPVTTSRSSRSQGPPGRKFTRTVVVVDSLYDSVPRGAIRQELHHKGLVVSFVDIWTNWSEEEVYSGIESSLKGDIDHSKPYPRFEYLQASSGKLIKPNVPPNHSWSGDKVQRLAGQGDIYICPTYPFTVQDIGDQHEVAVHRETPDAPQSSGVQTSCLSRSSVAEIDQEHDEHMEQLQTLRDMFPEIDHVYLSRTLQQCNWVTSDAAEKLLDLRDTVELPHSGITSTHHRDSADIKDSMELPPNSEVNPASSFQVTALVRPSTSVVTREAQLSSSASSSSSTCGFPLSPSAFDFEANISPEDLLGRVSRQVLMQGRYVDLTVNRERVWRTAVGFYKGCMKNPGQLRREVRIEFEGEEGVDAGALRNEFYAILMRELDDKLFEGCENSRLPKKDSNLQRMFETAGVIMAHSVLQGGPGFPCLCPAAYSYMLHLDKERALEKLPSIQDIPRNAATSGLLTLIEELDAAREESDIDSILDKAENMAVINASNWSPVRAITIVSKADLLQELVYSEVIDKRHHQLKSIRTGLDYLCVAAICKKYPEKLQHLFVHEEGRSSLTLRRMRSLISVPCSGLDAEQSQAVGWMMDFIRCRSSEDPNEELEGKTKANLGDILQFMTRLREIPPLGFHKKIAVFFLERAKVLPEVSACFYTIYLPVCLGSRELFFQRFDQAVLYSLHHFGQE